MIPLVTGEDALRRLFAAITEHTFQVELGVADPPLTDYLVEMLLRFSRMDAVYRHRAPDGQRLVEVVDMLEEAGQRTSTSRRELYRHIGDYTLFWTGLYPDALTRLQAVDRRDHLIDFEQKGRESYYIASTYEEGPFEDEAPVLRRLSEHFDLCRHGLNRVREEFSRTGDRAAAFEPLDDFDQSGP